MKVLVSGEISPNLVTLVPTFSGGIIPGHSKEICELVFLDQVILLRVLLDEVTADGGRRRLVVVVWSSFVIKDFVLLGPDGLRPDVAILQLPADVAHVLSIDNFASGVSFVSFDDRLCVDGRCRCCCDVIATLQPTLATFQNVFERLFASQNSFDATTRQKAEVLSDLSFYDIFWKFVLK